MFKFVWKKIYWFIVLAAVLVVLLVVAAVLYFVLIDKNDSKKFPKEFLFGSATSSYQIEGGWNSDGKGPSIWDEFTHSHPELFPDGDNGDVAANSYDLYKEDVKLLKEIGVNHYRFSISWPRILPTGQISSINPLGIKYYHNLIDELLLNGIEPMITMFHWDLPQALENVGGWLNLKIVDYFEDYAKVLFDSYGSKVKYWITINEPLQICEFGYGTGYFAPHINSSGIGTYLCGHHVLLAHSRAYHLYKNKYQTKDGQIGITIFSEFAWPKNPNSTEDLSAVNRSVEFSLGLYAHPIFSKTGDYPPLVKEIINRNSDQMQQSRLPEFTASQVELLKGSADFLGLNYYYSGIAEPINTVELEKVENPSYKRDKSVKLTYNESWPVATGNWIYSVPNGLRDLLKRIHNEYNGPKVIVTENGWADDGQLNDTGRVDYLTGHLQAVLDAIWEDGCNVAGYTYWSLLDNFEWRQGYTLKFGVVNVNFTSQTRERTLKQSALVYRKIIENREISISL